MTSRNIIPSSTLRCSRPCRENLCLRVGSNRPSARQLASARIARCPRTHGVELCHPVWGPGGHPMRRAVLRRWVHLCFGWEYVSAERGPANHSYDCAISGKEQPSGVGENGIAQHSSSSGARRSAGLAPRSAEHSGPSRTVCGEDYCSGGAGGASFMRFMRCCIRASWLASISFNCDCCSAVSNWYSWL